MIQKIIIFILKLFGFNIEQEQENSETKKTIYQQKPLMTDTEYEFYLKLKSLENEYTIIPQISLSSIVKKINNTNYYTDLFRIIDFAIFSKDVNELLLLIELNDSTHNTKSRKDRDLKVQKICNDCNIKLMKFYTSYPNEKEYVIGRILKEIRKENDGESDISPSPTS